MASTGDFGAIELCESCSAIGEVRCRDPFTADRFPPFRRKPFEMTKDFVFGVIKERNMIEGFVRRIAESTTG